MEENNSLQDEEISLIDLIAVLWKHRTLIILTTVLAAFICVWLSIISLKLPPEKSFMPNKYTPKAQMLINKGSSVSSSSSLRSLASFASVNLSSDDNLSYSSLAQYLVGSNKLLDSVVNNFGFIEKWKIEKSPISESRTILKKKLKSEFDDETGVFTVSFEDTDPILGKNVVNFVVELLESMFEELGVDKNTLKKANLEKNIEETHSEILKLQKKIENIGFSANSVTAGASTSIADNAAFAKIELDVQEEVYKQLKVQYEVLKTEMASEQPVFQILEYAEVPDKKSGPSRGKLCIIVTFAAFFISVFVAFLLNAITNIKNDSEAMAKLKGKTNEK